MVTLSESSLIPRGENEQLEDTPAPICEVNQGIADKKEKARVVADNGKYARGAGLTTPAESAPLFRALAECCGNL